MGAWAEGIQAGDPTILSWFSQNRHVFERAFINRDRTSLECADYLKHGFKIDPPASPPVFVCAIPKSGSTSLCRLLAASLGKMSADGHNRNSVVHALDVDFLRYPISAGAVIHSHLPPHADLLALLKALDATPIILMRNILDALESRHRHEQSAPHNEAFGLPTDIDSMVHRHAYDYLSFASQWLQTCAKIGWPILYFEDNVKDWRAAIERAGAIAGATPTNVDAIVSAYERQSAEKPSEYRITTGEKHSLPDHLVEFVLDLAAKFNGPDMSHLLER